jgi:tRNA threonylcarbamoyladenosine biosynthesis protein TsaB
MLVLGINTVGNACDAALLDDARVIASRSEPMEQGHDARLAPLVVELMREAAIGVGQLERIAVIVGPGSFAGVRVGVAFARGLGLALETQVAGVTSLEALGAGEGRVLGLLPAKRRPPEVTWWAQVLVDGVGIGQPEEADRDRLVAMATGVSKILGGDVAGLAVAAAAPTAINAARFALRFAAGAALPPPTPVYARAPDAKPQMPKPVAQA